MHRCWKQNAGQLLRKTILQCLKKLKPKLPCSPWYILLGIYSKEWKAGTPGGICTSITTAALFTIVKKRKQPKGPRKNQWVDNMCSAHTMEYYSAFRSNEILTQAAIVMNLEDIRLSDISQVLKNEEWVSPLT